MSPSIVDLIRALAAVGELYWTPAVGGRTRDEFRALAETEWQVVLGAFLGSYGFERAGASPYYGTAAQEAVLTVPGLGPGAGSEDTVWRVS